jgi:methylthioribose-1-phosphate isomerase
VNVLIAGIPTPDLISHIRERYGEGVRLFVAESRPFEAEVSRQIAAAREAGCSVTLFTDNMAGALLQEHDIGAVWSLYSKREKDTFTAINGARMSAILARAHGVPFLFFPCPSLPRVENGGFAGSPVAVAGSDYIPHELDTVRADLVAEAV